MLINIVLMWFKIVHNSICSSTFYHPYFNFLHTNNITLEESGSVQKAVVGFCSTNNVRILKNALPI